MESIYRKHIAIKYEIYLFSAQLMGGGENEDMHEVLNN